eukprot:CAMPEP_0113941170 /NCGR_PEP_ID=MMETSP1339-20121228/7150_1 /TAXON_ID=94617 /ORGANISM="Fibrocapsa japonica" /LENGTH=51 /DNA_ID=CAMNT_0000945239 /DNA_START=587 /DNA_END=738 /DNA_ORIENTATION=- /assembly_acc=CAM_ASM_000762
MDDDPVDPALAGERTDEVLAGPTPGPGPGPLALPPDPRSLAISDMLVSDVS